jgi:hypothetical protein
VLSPLTDFTYPSEKLDPQCNQLRSASEVARMTSSGRCFKAVIAVIGPEGPCYSCVTGGEQRSSRLSAKCNSRKECRVL